MSRRRNTVYRYRGPKRKRNKGKSDFPIGRSKRLRRIHFFMWAYICHLGSNKCLKCDSFGPLTIDHIHARGLGGPNTIDNVQPLCSKCNGKKGRNHEDLRNNAMKKFIGMPSEDAHTIAFLWWRETKGCKTPRPYPVPASVDKAARAGGNSRVNLGNGRRAVGVFSMETLVPQTVRDALLAITDIGDGSLALLVAPNKDSDNEST